MVLKDLIQLFEAENTVKENALWIGVRQLAVIEHANLFRDHLAQPFRSSSKDCGWEKLKTLVLDSVSSDGHKASRKRL